MCLVFLCLLAFGATHAAAAKVEVTPVTKVVQLLTAMAAKGKNAKQQEQVAFAAKTQFCDDTKKEKTRAITEERQTLSNLKAAIGSQTAKIAKLTKQISANQKDADTWGSDIIAASKVRGIERTDFEKTNKDYGESIDALGRAISTLKAKTADTAQSAGSLMQVSSLSLIPDNAKKAIDSFVQQGQAEHDLFDSAPEANAYEFQSTGVIQMLAKLEDKFTEERVTLQKEETNSKHAHDMLLQNLNTQVGEAQKDIKDHTQEKMRTKQAKAGAESDQHEQTKLLTADTKYLKDLTASCSMEKSEFEAAQLMRADEIVAIDKAVEIISSGSVAGKAAKHLPTLLQANTAPTLGQLRSNVDSQIQGKVAEFLHAQAAKFNSRVLETVALHAAADPMLKVKKMIKELIVKLHEEANAEADHKGFCDSSLATNQATRTEKTSEVSTLTAEIDQLDASMAKLGSELVKLNKQVVEGDKAMARSTEIRTADKAKNKNTIEDAQEAQAAVAQALRVLKEFYQKAADAAAASASFLQAPYTGMGGENGGVIGMLEVIETDFARLESQTKASESTDQQEYDEFMSQSNVDKAGKNSAIDHKVGKKTETEATLNIKKNDLEGTQKELTAALNVFEKLKPACVATGVSYEDRVARRKEEIESMKEALQVLEGGEVSLLQA